MTMKKMVGLCLPRPADADLTLVKDAGVEWLRASFRFPFKERSGRNSPEFEASLSEAQRRKSLGFSLLGTSPGPGSSRYDPKLDKTVWQSSVPEWGGSPEDAEYYQVIEEACAVIAREAEDLVEFWQIANEPDVHIFRGPLSDRQMIDFLFAAARGIGRGNSAAMPGINVGLGHGRWRTALEAVYTPPDSPFKSGFIGIDGYLGSWSSGGPDDWPKYIDEIHRITGRPVIINEWGYSSLQGAPKEKEREYYNQDVCRNKTWKYVWRKEHSPDEQAEYVKACLKIFDDHPRVLGHFFFRWDDTQTCWQCGEQQCPAECAWGLVDVEGRPKPAYDTFRASVKGA